MYLYIQATSIKQISKLFFDERNVLNELVSVCLKERENHTFCDNVLTSEVSSSVNCVIGLFYLIIILFEYLKSLVNVF